MRLIVLLTAAVLAGMAFARGDSADNQMRDQVKLTGVFSDLSHHEGTGDIAGLEVFVLRGRGGFYALVQAAEGAPGAPFLVAAEVDRTSGTITFTTPDNQPLSGLPSGWRFRGTITEAELVGRFDGSDHEFRLPRGDSYWQ